MIVRYKNFGIAGTNELELLIHIGLEYGRNETRVSQNHRVYENFSVNRDLKGLL